MWKSAQNLLLSIAAIILALFWLGLGVSSPPEQRTRGYLGLEFSSLTRAAEGRAPFLSGGGALITKVVNESPAASAGLAPGVIVTALDAQPVSSAADAAEFLESRKAGQGVNLTIYDPALSGTHARKVRVVLAAHPPNYATVFTVQPPRMLARAWDFKPSMAAHAAWSPAIARGAVDPLALQVLARGKCRAVAPEDWRIADSNPDGTGFALISQFARARAIFAAVRSDRVVSPESTVSRVLAKFARITPELGASENANFGFRVVDFGSQAGYAGFALYRVNRQGRTGSTLTVRAVAVPAADVGALAPLAGAVALSIRCSDVLPDSPQPFDDALAPTSVSVRCLRDVCDESDFAGAYNEVMHTGYVHSPDGENFLIDPRKDIWATGPSGPGTYRQVRGILEKLEPGRTN